MNFSVLMSVYCKESPICFDRALSSILKEQVLSPNEVVLVCDGPLNDELDNIIENYRKLYVDVLKVYRLKDNMGLGNALNYGLGYCSYEYIARADSDDVCMPERFAKQIGYLKEHPEISAIGSDIQEFSDDPNLLQTYKKMPQTHDQVLEMAKFRNPINHMTVVFKKSAVETVGSYQHLQYLEDYYLWVRLLANGYKIENINEPLVRACVGNGMVQRRGSRAYIESWRTLNRYILNNRMINKLEYIRNMIAVRAFVYIPSGLKNFIYKFVLRK